MIDFDAGPLRGLDEASRRRIEAAGVVRSLAPNERLFEVGEDADLLYVVLRGVVEVGVGEETLRRAEPGHTLGEESMLGLPRRAHAQAHGQAEVFGVTASLLERAWTRAGGRPAAAAERRRLERAVVADLLRGMVPGVEEGALEYLLDGSSLRTVEADSFLARAGDPCAAAAFLLDGVAHVRPAGSRAVESVVMATDVVGIRSALCGTPWPHDLIAAGTCRVVWIRAAALREALGPSATALEASSTARAKGRGLILQTMQAGPRPALVDIHRLSRARSLLIIDQDACVRCGQCTRACASSHDDGLPRMMRVGPRLVARVGSGISQPHPWLLARSCQHCSSPACLPDCPTAAITRGPHGEVQIDAALCTGCGACAKACPWDAIELAPRPPRTPSPPQGPFESLAVKCDLCAGAAGPACVSACPTQALARVDAATEVVEAAALLRRPVPRGRPGALPWPWIGSAGIATMLSLGAWAANARPGWIPGAGPGLWIGWFAAFALAASVGYGALRRTPLGRGAPGLVLHGVSGSAVCAGVWVHGGGRLEGQPGVLAGVVLLAVALGLYGLIAYRVLPGRLTRLEAEVRDEVDDTPDDADALMKAIGGRGDALKHLTASVLLPYVKAVGGGAWLVVTGRSLQDEKRRLRADLEARIGEERIARMDGLDDALATVVTMRARIPRRVLRTLLRGWLVPHIVLSAVGLVLLLVHVFTQAVLA